MQVHRLMRNSQHTAPSNIRFIVGSCMTAPEAAIAGTNITQNPYTNPNE